MCQVQTMRGFVVVVVVVVVVVATVPAGYFTVVNLTAFSGAAQERQ